MKAVREKKVHSKKQRIALASMLVVLSIAACVFVSFTYVSSTNTLTGLMAEFPDAKVVMVSAVGQKAQVFEALGKGAKDFIIKPFEPERVLIAIERLFE